MSISQKHKNFIELVVSGLTQKEAYKVSIGKKGVSEGVAEVKGSQLAKKYAIQIAEARQRVGKALEQAQDLAASTEALKSILSKVERMQILTQIAKGEIKVENEVTIKGKKAIIVSPANLKDRITAMAELNKMDGSYTPIEINGEITEIRRTVINKAAK